MVGAAAEAQLAACDDELLIKLCRDGDAAAWNALIDKYKNLIYSIPVKLGQHQDAADVLQSVCLQLLRELPRLLDPKALPKWLMQVTYHECLALQRAGRRYEELSDEAQPVPDPSPLPEMLLVELGREQALRDAVSALPARCAELVRMLFFEEPARPYEDVAQQLGIATGSIGFIRGRCLKKLRQRLEQAGIS